MLIVYTNQRGKLIGEKIASESSNLISVTELTEEEFRRHQKIVFIGALGICVRKIAPFLNDKHTDPGVVCVDTTGRFVIPVVSGHIGGANELSKEIARKIGAQAIITTQSDNLNIWQLDLLEKKYGWTPEITGGSMNEAIAKFVNGEKTAFYTEMKSDDIAELLSTKPEWVDVYDDFDSIEKNDYQLIIAITPRVFEDAKSSIVLWFRPKTLSLGIGCRHACAPEGIADFIKNDMLSKGYSPLSVGSISTIELKKDELLIDELTKAFENVRLNIYSADDLKGIEVPNPSDKVKEVTGTAGVAESSAILSSGDGSLVIEKQKVRLTEGNDFTYAVAIDRVTEQKGHIEIVGAGPGDPELISVKGKRFLEHADLILYAGSLVPEELTYYAKDGCVVKSSADMNLEEQFDLMKSFYNKGKSVVRLHTGDPCIYGAIQEQMALFDSWGMSYHITPGISSFQAAAAELKSQFTIPEKVQTIILTRGEGRTPMPEKESLSKLAQSQSTMCIFLSAGIAEKVQEELLKAYPPTTPVAACYKLTWKDQKIYRGELRNLAKIVKDNHLTLTTLLVVGEAIDNRSGLSKLYDRNFKHLFRKK